eukprot:3048728-Pyramimonas_sp.AAC.1
MGRGLPSALESRYIFFFKESVRLLDSSQEFDAMFDLECVLTGSVNFSDTDENAKHEFIELGTGRKLSPSCMWRKIDWKELNPPGGLVRLDAALK